MPEESKISKAQQKAVHKYVKNNYDRLEITVPKGRKAEIKEHAEAHGESVNSFIVRAVNETIKRDGTVAVSSTKPATSVAKSQESVTIIQESVPSLPKKQKPQYRAFIDADAKLVDLPELLTNVKYQLEIGETFGMDVLATLLEKARQQEAGKESAAHQ